MLEALRLKSERSGSTSVESSVSRGWTQGGGAEAVSFPKATQHKINRQPQKPSLRICVITRKPPH